MYHRTAQGKVAWCEFAKAILEHESIDKKSHIAPIEQESIHSRTKRPVFSAVF